MAHAPFVGNEIRSRMGAESSHLAMAEHPNQGDPIAKTFAQKDAARAGGTVAPVPSSARDLSAMGNRAWSDEKCGCRGCQAESPEMTAVLGPRHPSTFANSGYGKGATARAGLAPSSTSRSTVARGERTDARKEKWRQDAKATSTGFAGRSKGVSL